MTLLRNSLSRNTIALHVVVACGFFSTASAQEPETVEHSTLEPSINAELRYDDNIFLSAANEKASLITILSPALLAIVKPSRHRLQFLYQGEFASYASSSADNYDDHTFQAAALLELGIRGLLDLTGSYQSGHENRGAGLSEGLEPGSDAFLREPDQYDQTQFAGKFSYGATGTRGRLVFEAGRRDLEYTNNRDRTRFFDYDNTHGGGAFYLRVMPSTSLFLSVRADDFEYRFDRSSQPSLNSLEYRVLVGATWNVTGKSTGAVRFGHVEKKYDDDARRNFSEASWEVDVRWSLRSYSHLDFATRRYPSEITSVTGDVIDNTRYSVGWSHQWTPRIMSRLETLHSRQEFRGSVEARVERFNRHGLTLSYEMRRWLAWNFGVSIASQNSNIERFDFDANVVSLGADVTF